MNRADYPGIRETLYWQVLENGLSVYVVPKPGYSKTFAMFATEYGGADRRFTLGGELHDTPAGVAHYLEHKMFDMPDGNAMAAFSALGADPNAYTSQSMTAYHFECTHDFEQNLRTLLGFVSTPYFTTESVEKERGIISQEILMYEDSPDYKVFTDLMECLFDHSPLRHSVAGTVQSIQDITPETLYACHKVFYHPANMALAVVGDVDPERVCAVARDCLAKEAAEKPGHDYGEAEAPLPVKRSSERRMLVSAPQFLIGARTELAPKGAENLRQKLVSGLALRCLAGRSSPFFTRLYAEGLLNTDFDCEAYPAAGHVCLMFGGESRQPQAVLDALCTEIEKVSVHGFDEDFFRRQKKASYGGSVRSLGSFESLAGSLTEGCFGGYDALDAFEVSASVTAEECADFIRRCLGPDSLAMSVVFPA